MNSGNGPYQQKREGMVEINIWDPFKRTLRSRINESFLIYADYVSLRNRPSFQLFARNPRRHSIKGTSRCGDRYMGN